jgi:hypothetical protein
MPFLFVVLASWLFSSATAEKRWRETLLEQARLRILHWYTDPDLVENPQTRNGIEVRMLKQDQSCGGDKVPVTYAEFTVSGAQPIDVFHAMLDTPAQKVWNPQMASVQDLGDWKSEGARAWGVVFDIPLISDREFFQWQVADANFSTEEFWLVFSTQNNQQLKQISPIQAGATESQNCLGAYHITKHPEGAHVIITQQVNAHPFFMFPLHQILNFFPPAWSGTLDFVRQMSDRARHLAKTGESPVVPSFMLQGPAPVQRTNPSPALVDLKAQASPSILVVAPRTQASPSHPVAAPTLADATPMPPLLIGAASPTTDQPIRQFRQIETFEDLQPTKSPTTGGFNLLGFGTAFVVAPCLCLCVAAAGLGAGKCVGSKIESILDGDNFASRQSSFSTSRTISIEEEGLL